VPDEPGEKHFDFTRESVETDRVFHSCFGGTVEGFDQNAEDRQTRRQGDGERRRVEDRGLSNCLQSQEV
jgi:hypothetical protein